MSLDRQHGTLTFACDDAKCLATFELSKETDFHLVWTAAKRDGWKTRKIAGEWLHFCGDCEP